MVVIRKMRALCLICFGVLMNAASSQGEVLSDLNLSQVGNFSLSQIIAGLIFGAIGFIAFMYGKKNALWIQMVIGVALMIYPYFISGTFVIYFVGFVLVAALYFWRE